MVPGTPKDVDFGDFKPNSPGGQRGKGQALQRQPFEGRPLTQSIVSHHKDNRLSLKAMPEFGRLIHP
jgi:hypothetical protein